MRASLPGSAREPKNARRDSMTWRKRAACMPKGMEFNLFVYNDIGWEAGEGRKVWEREWQK
jgi:hypothetical protein